MSISEWDTNHFGYPVAKVTPYNFQDVEAKCYIASVGGKDIEGMKILHDNGFEYITSNYYLRRKPIFSPLYKAKEYLIKPKELAFVCSMAENSFFTSHFYKDNRFDYIKVNEMFNSWVKSFYDKTGKLLREVFPTSYKQKTKEILVVKNKDKDVVGFATLSYGDPYLYEIELVHFCIDRKYRGLGISQKLLNIVFDRISNHIHSHLKTKTQVDNIPAIHLYTSNGFKIYKMEHIYHRWKE